MIKLLNRKSHSAGRFASSVFFASWVSVMLGALIASFEVAPAFAGGIVVTLPSMLLFHAVIGLGEGAITTVLITSLQRLNPAVIGSLTFLRERAEL